MHQELYDAPGLMVAIGSNETRAVWLGWSKEGSELDLLDGVQVGSQSKLYVLQTWDATFGDAIAFGVAHHEDSIIGKWYARSRKLTAVIAKKAQELQRLLGSDAVMSGHLVAA